MTSKNSQLFKAQLSPWEAELRLKVDQSAERTRVRKVFARGPLQIQKVLYPEDQAIAHVFILHPPSGIAQSDQLDIHISAHGKSHSVFATPGATRWYKSSTNARGPSRQTIQVTLNDRACVEWLPYENLYYDQTWAHNRLEIHLDIGCRMLGWDMHQFGRTSCGERWQDGRARNELFFYVQGELFWAESANWTSENTNEPNDQHQLSGHSFIGCLWSYGPSLNDNDYELLASSLSSEQDCLSGISQLKTPMVLKQSLDPQSSNTQENCSLIIMRVLSNNPQRARTVCEQTRDFLRPRVMSVASSDLRIWAT